MNRDSRDQKRGQHRLSCLLCDSSGQIELESGGSKSVHSPIQCLDMAVERNPGIIAVNFWQMPIREREALVELCAALKRNSCTRNTPVLALLHDKHRKLTEALKNAGVDFVRFMGETALSSSQLLEIVNNLETKDRVERQLMIMCHYLHYETIDARREMIVCGAYMDRMVLGGKWLHEICQSIEHLNCQYFLNPRSKS